MGSEEKEELPCIQCHRKNKNCTMGSEEEEPLVYVVMGRKCDGLYGHSQKTGLVYRMTE